MPHVLMLTHRLPFPPDRGDRIRKYHMLLELSRHYHVSLACIDDEPTTDQTPQQLEVLRSLTHRLAVRKINPHFSKLRAAAALATGQPMTPHYAYRSDLANTIQHWHQIEPFTAVLTVCSSMVRYSRQLNRQSILDKPGPRQIFDLMDVDSRKWAAYAEQSRFPMNRIYSAESARLAHVERGELDHFDHVTLVSEAEAETYTQHIGEHPGTRVIRQGVDLDFFRPMPDAANHQIVFVGVLDYKPNIDAVTWFAHHVMPGLRDKLPRAHFRIVGRSPTPQVRQLTKHAGVEVVGSVPDVRPFLAEASVVVAPLQIARGVQTKIIEAMACARVAVCSPGAAQGIADPQHRLAKADRDLLIADQPKQWIDTLQRVLTDDPMRQAIAQSAAKCAEQRFGWEQSLASLPRLMMGTPTPNMLQLTRPSFPAGTTNHLANLTVRPDAA